MKKLLGVLMTGTALCLFAFGCSGGSSGTGAQAPPGESPEEIEKEILESGGGAGAEEGSEAEATEKEEEMDMDMPEM